MSKVQVIVTGHGTFADGFKGALHLLASVPDNWSFVNFSEGMSDKQLQAKFETILGSDPMIVRRSDVHQVHVRIGHKFLI